MQTNTEYLHQMVDCYYIIKKHVIYIYQMAWFLRFYRDKILG